MWKSNSKQSKDKISKGSLVIIDMPDFIGEYVPSISKVACSYKEKMLHFSNVSNAFGSLFGEEHHLIEVPRAVILYNKTHFLKSVLELSEAYKEDSLDSLFFYGRKIVLPVHEGYLMPVSKIKDPHKRGLCYREWEMLKTKGYSNLIT